MIAETPPSTKLGRKDSLAENTTENLNDFKEPKTFDLF